MREIKFRGKDLDGKKRWWYGSLAYFPDSQSAHIIPCGTCKGDQVICDFVEVQKDTVGQFTGILDVDGNEIYEGDILVFGENDDVWPNVRCPFEVAEDNPPYKVNWYLDRFALICAADNGVEDFDYIDEKTLVNKNFKVLGNIYDNPKLYERD